MREASSYHFTKTKITINYIDSVYSSKTTLALNITIGFCSIYTNLGNVYRYMKPFIGRMFLE